MTQTPALAIIDPATPQDITAAKRLCLEYAESLGFSLCFQGFDAEMAEFPASYSTPRRGALRLGLLDGQPAGIVALRDLGQGVCEMKRMYVAPAARRTGLGRALALAILQAGRDLGYRAMKLDTLASMTAAGALYAALGFRPCAKYNDNPMTDARFFELPL
jgi:ribosomal protein S18 acetylase RimI-like enzyme